MSEMQISVDDLRAKQLRIRELIGRLAERTGLTPERAMLYAADFGLSNGERVCSLLWRILDSMPQDENTEALRNAFGGEGSHPSLKGRRSALASLRGVRPEVIKARESAAMTRMSELVLARRCLPDSDISGTEVLVEAITRLERALTQATTVLREINCRLKRSGD